MNTVQALLHTHSGRLLVLGTALAATGVTIWDNHRGRNHAANNFDTKINTKIDDVNIKIDGVRADIDRIERKLENSQSMILITGFHTMNALDGNKKPMREWLQRFERCVQSGGEDCDPVPKA
ncbi:hypothetical protein L873DRAFT_1822408 [Choiromyces venosus 120613-1]|uniref:Fungal N-terminal domain-containing protein n=1 Tax=Choiromyces venosus 120613-1 TaxID=1336337 RepID=A0A3N4J735_9PEZI|nr:hypothetical protein L873DRAFT_1822408 [Choiromyces venosus 120613-1]